MEREKSILIKIPQDYINVREQPTTLSKVVGKLHRGAYVYNVTIYTESRSVGWVSLELESGVKGFASLQNGSVAFAPATPSGGPLNTYSSVILNVPGRSQWGDDADYSPGDCGIAVAAGTLQFYGRYYTIDQLINLANLPKGKYTYSFNEVQRAYAVGDVKTQFVLGATWPLIKQEIIAGRPVMVLGKYSNFSGNQDSFIGFHFVNVIGFEADRVVINDSDFKGDRVSEGLGRKVYLSEFENFIKSGSYQALFVSP